MITTIIFDMNGVITDDEEIHELATQQVFNQIGITITADIYREYCLGRTDTSAFKELLQKFEATDKTAVELIAAKSILYQRLIKGNLKVYPDILALIDRLHTKYTLALTSSSTFEEVHMVMTQLNIGNLFKVIVSSKDVEHGKPDPEPYILTANRLQVDCAECLVIEDSRNGVLSAKSAGMKCIAISTTEVPNELGMADHVVESFSEITDTLIRELESL